MYSNHFSQEMMWMYNFFFVFSINRLYLNNIYVFCTNTYRKFVITKQRTMVSSLLWSLRTLLYRRPEQWLWILVQRFWYASCTGTSAYGHDGNSTSHKTERRMLQDNLKCNNTYITYPSIHLNISTIRIIKIIYYFIIQCTESTGKWYHSKYTGQRWPWNDFF